VRAWKFVRVIKRELNRKERSVLCDSLDLFGYQLEFERASGWWWLEMRSYKGIDIIGWWCCEHLLEICGSDVFYLEHSEGDRLNMRRWLSIIEHSIEWVYEIWYLFCIEVIVVFWVFAFEFAHFTLSKIFCNIRKLPEFGASFWNIFFYCLDYSVKFFLWDVHIGESERLKIIIFIFEIFFHGIFCVLIHGAFIYR